MSNELFRRQFLKAGVGFIGAAAGTVVCSDFSTVVLAQSCGTQDRWRFCRKCQAMFFNGYDDKGACAAGGSHEPAGFEFALPHSCPETPKAQKDWRFCRKCQAMFFNGYPNKGTCPAGGTHKAAGYNFVLPHDVSPTSTTQEEWRFCGKCQVMFFNGYDNAGACAAGGTHEGAGYNFVLPHYP
jgi:hypothetical protein